MSRPDYDSFLQASDPDGGWLTAEAIEDIISQTERACSPHRLNKNVDRTRLSLAIATLACKRVQQAPLRKKLDAREFSKIKNALRAIERYNDLALSYALKNNPPPPLSRSCLARQREWLDENKEYYKDHLGGPHKQFYDREFYRIALGLFQAAFPRKITLSASHSTGSPAAQFMIDLLEAVMSP
jgi:hypothetical protein